jgi:hypothetical protein
MATTNRWTAGTGLGGIIGISAQSDNISNCANYGQISIANKNAQGHLYAGGVVGWAMQETNNNNATGVKSPAMVMKNLTNYANLTFTGNALRYYVGGVIGCITTNQTEDKKRYWEEISGLKNYSNLTFSTTETEGSLYAYGGVIGFAEVVTLYHAEYIPIDSSEFYGDLIADGKTNVGAILGCKRNVAMTTANPEDPTGKGFIAEKCMIGGKVKKLATYYVEEAGGTEEVTENLEVALDSDTWYRYIYSTAVEQSVAESDGCSLLTENPVQ